MATFIFFADEARKRRADGRNTAVAQGVDVAAARAAAEALIDEPGAFAEFLVVEIDGAAPPFVVEGHTPVGARGQTTWPTLARGGDWLPGA